MRLLSLIPASIIILYFAGCNKADHKSLIETSFDYKKGEFFLNAQNDSAFYYFNKVVAGSADSLQIAMAYNKMAVIQADAGDYYGSQENLMASLSHLKETNEKDHYCLFSNYNELGLSNLSLKNYDNVIEYFDHALKFVYNDDYKIYPLNNKALAYCKMKEYARAIPIYQSILERSRKNSLEYARVLSNLARAKWLQSPGYRATPELLLALQIRKNENDTWGLNASYSHLSDYYT